MRLEKHLGHPSKIRYSSSKAKHILYILPMQLLPLEGKGQKTQTRCPGGCGSVHFNSFTVKIQFH